MVCSHPIYLETGKTWVFACSIDWPGWCRRGRDEEAAIEVLLSYVPRYRAVVGPSFSGGEVDIVGRLAGNATTDFGAPSAFGPFDERPLDGKEAARQIGALEAAWQALDTIVQQAPPSLRKGPRGGGRDRDQIVEHVREAERTYARRFGVEVPPRTPWPQQREAIVAGIRNPPSEPKWPVRYSLRRIAWHVLDHAWEIEDRSE